jgi:HlyD family secretion protein
MSQVAAAPIPILAPPGSGAIERPPKASATGRHRNRNITVLVVALVVAAALAAMLWYRRPHPAASAFRTVVVVRTDLTQRVTATGTVQPVITSPVGAQVSGIVWKLHADYNSKVKTGEVMVELDPALFQNAVALATAQLAQAEASLTSAQATALGARVARDRTLSLERQSLASNADLDAAEAIFGQSAGLSRASAAQIALARAQLDRAKLDLQHSIIRAPVNGTVIARNIDIGQAVASTLTAPTLFTIAQDMRKMQVHAAVDEADIGGVRTGQEASFTVDAFGGQIFRGAVWQVRNAPLTLSNVVTYDVVLDVDNPEEKLRPGMTANVSILIVTKNQVTAVSNEALRFRPAVGPAAASTTRIVSANAPSGAAVYVPQGSVPERVAIKVGVTDGNMTEVDGIEPGREVIVDIARDKSKAAAAGGAAHGP